MTLSKKKTTESNVKAKGDPSKGLFIQMLTRDISLADCIIDLLDNSVDGIRAFYHRKGSKIPAMEAYKGYQVNVTFDGTHFTIEDNCGGIPVDVAVNYAFCFGRRDDDNRELATSGAIGLYGIGMKRSMFKMGRVIDLLSSTGKESFRLPLNVEEWRKQKEPDDPDRDLWDFTLQDVERTATDVPKGTSLTIKDLYTDIAAEFRTPGFKNQLILTLRRQYAFIIQNGLLLKINGQLVTPIMPTFRIGKDIAPMRIQQTSGNVTFEVVAGMSSPPPEDASATSSYPDAEIYGWYVICNDRVIVSADKTSLTTWGPPPLPAWHNQYNGFLGLLRFTSEDPRLLPWTTTKRSVDVSSNVYKQALIPARLAARQFVDYTNRRKGDVRRLKKLELATTSESLTTVPPQERMQLPKPTAKKTVRIQYDAPKEVVQAVAKALGLDRVSASQVGIKTFEYFVDREIED